MANLFKVAAFGAVLAAAAVGANAQTMSNTVVPGQSIANLPPQGPRASSLINIPNEPHVPVVQTGNYPGPGPGAGNGIVPPRFEKPGDWDQNVALHPYTSGMGPKPN